MKTIPENKPQQILTNAILKWQPKSLVSLYSGGYDSAVTTHLIHTLDTHGLPIHVAAIDTQLAADGWREYISSVADSQKWNFKIYSSDKAWSQFIVRVIEAIHMAMKKNRADKTLFVSGVRRAESSFRAGAAEVQRIGHSNRIFAAPIVHWTQEDCDIYRIENNLPDNPFYGTVKGSGDCQCNWGNFISLETLEKYSPQLAQGNVALIDKLSRDLHGFGWDSREFESQSRLVEDVEPAILTEPFLCQGCSRAKIRVSTEAVESLMLQRGLFD